MSHVIFWESVEKLLMSCRIFSDFMESIRKLLPDYIDVTFSQKINSVIQTDSNYVELIFSPQYSHKNINFVFDLINTQPEILRQVIPAFAFRRVKRIPSTPGIYATYAQMESPYFKKLVDSLIFFTNFSTKKLIKFVDEAVLLLLTFQIQRKSQMKKDENYFEPLDTIKVITKHLICCNICGRLSLRLPLKEKEKWLRTLNIQSQKQKKYHCTRQCEYLASLSND